MLNIFGKKTKPYLEIPIGETIRYIDAESNNGEILDYEVIEAIELPGGQYCGYKCNSNGNSMKIFMAQHIKCEDGKYFYINSSENYVKS